MLRAGAAVDEDDESDEDDKLFSLGRVVVTGCGVLDMTESCALDVLISPNPLLRGVVVVVVESALLADEAKAGAVVLCKPREGDG